MVLGRDVSGTVRVRGADRLAAALILDMGTGLVRGIAIEQTTDAALAHAVATALTQPAGDLPPGAPARVLCAGGLADPVRTALTTAASTTRSSPVPVIVEVQPGPEAEDIFDSFLGHMSGRTQPDELPTPADWQQLIEQAAEFCRTEPWRRWSDEHDLAVDLRLPDDAARYVAVIMGQAGLQHGLVLYPGDQLPPGVRNRESEQEPPPPGTLLLTLDPPGEVPAELSAKAIRYGWTTGDPGNAADGEGGEALVPVFMTVTEHGPAEIGRDDAHRLIAGIAAVLRLDSRGPTSAERAGEPVSGTIPIDGAPVRFSAQHRPHAEPANSGLRLHRAGQHELIPPGTPITLGHLGWDTLGELRAAARVHRPAPGDAPPPAGRELPLVVLSPRQPRHGPALAAAIAQLDPYGVSALEPDDGRTVLVLAGGEAAEILLDLPSEHPAITAFVRRYRQTKGRHVIMVADQASATGDGTVYGLYECHQPPPPRPPRQAPKKNAAKANPAGRSKR